jgi:hypothetical protein
MRDDPWEDLGYSKIPTALARRCVQTTPDPVPPPWVGQDWREYAGHRCADHDDEEEQ